MLKIRLTRTGRKNRPHYRLVVAEHSAPVKGKFIAILGSYDPLNKKVQLKKDEIIAWMNKGAKPSNTVAKLLKKQGIKHKSIVIVEYHRKPKAEAKEPANQEVKPETGEKQASAPAPETKAPESKQPKIETKTEPQEKSEQPKPTDKS